MDFFQGFLKSKDRKLSKTFHSSFRDTDDVQSLNDQLRKITNKTKNVMTSSFRYSINIHHSNIPAAQADGVNIYNSYAILGFCSQ